MTVDILAFGAHPDDVEMSAGGALLKFKKMGYKTAIIDLTRAELSSRGSEESRLEEIKAANKILNLDVRENLDLGDGIFEETKANRDLISSKIREYKAKIILAPYQKDRHPDHERCSRLVREANFYAGLKKYPIKGEAYRAKKIYYYMANTDFEPSFVLDISNEFLTKMTLFEAYGTQFIQKENDTESKTPISRPEFIEYGKARARFYGEKAGVLYGEPYFIESIPVYDSFQEL